MMSPHWRKCSAALAPLWAGITCAFSIAAWHSSVRHTFAKPLCYVQPLFLCLIRIARFCILY